MYCTLCGIFPWFSMPINVLNYGLLSVQIKTVIAIKVKVL